MRDLNIELQTVRIKNREEQSANKEATARKLKMLDLEGKLRRTAAENENPRLSVAFQMNQRLSKIGPSLSRFTQAGGPGKAVKKDAPTRFTVMNEIVEVDG